MRLLTPRIAAPQNNGSLLQRITDIGTDDFSLKGKPQLRDGGQIRQTRLRLGASPYPNTNLFG